MADKIEAIYIEMIQPQADADFGKMQLGRIYRMPKDRAERLIGIGVAKQGTEAAFEKQATARQERVDARRSRAGEFAALNDEAGAVWDTSTARDVTMAPEEGIRQAFAQGRLVNTDRLTDEDGLPLPQDATLEQILEARTRLGYGEAPFTAHDRSSVQGGGAHTYATDAAPTAPINAGSTLEGRAPLNAPSHRLSPTQLGNAAARDDDADDAKPKSASRAKK